METIRYCQDCGTDITARPLNARYCKPCRAERDRETARQAGRARYERQRAAKQHKERPNAAAPAREYAAQMQTADGLSYIINFNGKWKRIEKVCLRCGKRDDTVEGNWAPIYSLYNSRGNEEVPVLLCYPCYNYECTLTWEERKVG